MTDLHAWPCIPPALFRIRDAFMPSSINRRQSVASTTCMAAAAVAGDVCSAGVAEAAPSAYTSDRDSVDQHPPAPECFQDAKFGIYFHWGAFSVPAFDNEWYPRGMYEAGSSPNKHHIATYGRPSAWPYHHFIDGAKDLAGSTVEFAPKLKSAGGSSTPTSECSSSSMPVPGSPARSLSTMTASRCGTARSTSGTRWTRALVSTCCGCSPRPSAPRA